MGGGSCSFDYDNQTWCQKHTPNASTNKKVIPNTSSGMWNNLVQLKKSGLISEIKYVGDSLNDLGDANKRGFFPHLSIKGSTSTDVAHYALSSFDNNVLVGMKGYVKTEALTNWGFAKLHPEYYAKKLEGHNALFMEATKNSTRKTSKGVEYRVYGNVNAGAFSSKFLSQVDAKIDDGRPGTGRLLAIKNPYAEYVSDAEGSKICYDAVVTELDEKTIYHNDSNQKFGCDVMYIMEDVK